MTLKLGLKSTCITNVFEEFDIIDCTPVGTSIVARPTVDSKSEELIDTKNFAFP
jgi:hypothetical protein